MRTDRSNHRATSDTISSTPAITALPVPFRAWRQAPTLLSRDPHNRPGGVRLWTPHGWSILAPLVAALMLTTCFGLYDYFWLHSDSGLVLLLMLIFISEPVLMVPQTYYFSTDEAGIAISSRKGCRAVAWNEIEGIILVTPADLLTYRLMLRNAEPAEIRLYGYSARARREFITFIREHMGSSPSNGSGPIQPKSYDSSAVQEICA